LLFDNFWVAVRKVSTKVGPLANDRLESSTKGIAVFRVEWDANSDRKIVRSSLRKRKEQVIESGRNFASIDCISFPIRGVCEKDGRQDSPRAIRKWLVKVLCAEKSGL